MYHCLIILPPWAGGSELILRVPGGGRAQLSAGLFSFLLALHTFSYTTAPFAIFLGSSGEDTGPVLANLCSLFSSPTLFFLFISTTRAWYFRTGRMRFFDY